MMKDNIKFMLPLNLFGDKENILKVNNCATRLRLEVKDINKVNTEEIKKYYPAVQKINDNEIHIVTGINANLIAKSLKSLLENEGIGLKTALLLPLVGNIDNISNINNCATRLRLEVKDINKVNTEEIKKYYPAVQKINDNEIHIIIGTDANLLAQSLKKLLENEGISLKTISLLPMIGGIENITNINNCATRLRLEIKDINKVNTEEIKKYYPAVQKINDNEIHIITGTNANLLADELKKFVI
ncbi:PTS transporter subunit EIIB [uncultured Brachyspira sp.]|uniref:PTS transporter subunit EIIB n=2 Tax=uncultured Brachyspira sp. TaxID=221953 RepID=UPI0025D57476|nr:PTS transporter subunit EIIB [uncultured Brachyspira sp.]